MTTADNKRIAKNTIYLYIRTFVSMIITLYTSRKVLEILGVEDFGILGVVGGVMVLFSFLSNSMSVATQRFLTFELGRKDDNGFQNAFSMACIIHAILAILFVFLSETIGLWIVNTCLNIPSVRMNAANVVYQVSVISTAISILQIPYNAAVVSYERMHVYAYVGLGEAVFKLLVVYLLIISPVDKLITYSILLLVIKIIGCSIYRIYCIKNFPNCHIILKWNRSLFKSMACFTGWNMFGTIAITAKDQTTNLFLNIFGGPVFNAALSVTGQVSVAIHNLIGGFQSAVNPQLTKNYASGDSSAVCRLLYKSSKISFLLMLIVSLPVWFEIDYILHLWLVDVPPMATLFTRLVIIESLLDTLTGPMNTTLLATGRIKWYQVTLSIILLLSIPINYLLLKAGCHLATPLIVSVVLMMLSNVLRIIFCRNMLGLSVRMYVYEVILPIAGVGVFSLLPIMFVNSALNQSFLRLTICTIVGVVTVVFTSYAIGFTRSERQIILNIVRTRFSGVMRLCN